MKKDKNWLEKQIKKTLNIDGGSGERIEGFNKGLEFSLDLIDQLDEPELPVIPQFVADWIKECKKHGKSLSECLVTFNFNHEKAFNWTNAIRLDREEIIARAWLDDYTIEKEKMYRVVFPFTGSSEKTLIQRIFTGNTWADDVEDDFKIIAEDHKVEFTEQEIKAIDERYWAFAEEVTE